MKRLELTKQRFGKLFVHSSAGLKNGAVWWNCSCDCGNTIVVRGAELTNGKVKSCGCSRKRVGNTTTLVGKVFTKLTVISFDRNVNGKRFWLCSCECGNTVSVSTAKLNNGHTKSCGCMRKEIPHNHNAKALGVANRNYLISSYKTNAKRKNLEFLLTDSDVIYLFQGSCFYCGRPPSSVIQKPGTNGGYTYNGIDRLDNSKGYVLGNVVSCCKECNYRKNSTDYDEFVNWVFMVADNLRR